MTTDNQTDTQQFRSEKDTMGDYVYQYRHYHRAAYCRAGV